MTRLTFRDSRLLVPACRPLDQKKWIPIHTSTPARLHTAEFVRNGWRVIESAGGFIVRTPDGLVLELAEGGPEAA